MSKTMTLQCEAGHEWERPAQRGRPPRWCPVHKPGAVQPTGITSAPPFVTPDEPENPGPTPADAEIATALARPTKGVQLNLRGTQAIPPREMVHVSDVREGDWTHITGFRPVTRVKIYPRKKEVKLTWSDGSSKTYPFAVKREREEWKKGEDKFESVPFNLMVLREEHVKRG